MDIKQIKKIMGENFIGPDSLKHIGKELDILGYMKKNNKLPEIPFSKELLKKVAKTHILILGIPENNLGEKLTINTMRLFFGFDILRSEPCFYNQDWYLKEDFASNTNLSLDWYLISKEIDDTTRGQQPDIIEKELAKEYVFPSAVLTVFTFFAYYFNTGGKILWKNDFIWCADKDNNGDRIYTGRYEDLSHISKKGFNIHRHLSIRPCYGAVSVFK